MRLYLKFGPGVRELCGINEAEVLPALNLQKPGSFTYFNNWSERCNVEAEAKTG